MNTSKKRADLKYAAAEKVRLNLPNLNMVISKFSNDVIDHAFLAKLHCSDRCTTPALLRIEEAAQAARLGVLRVLTAFTV